MPLSKKQIAIINRLAQKKHRNRYKLFIVEGIKGVNEFLASNFELDRVYTVDKSVLTISSDKMIFIEETELKKISQLKTPNKVLALFKIPEEQLSRKRGLIVALDGVNDPGNLGTIIRLCDWFGVEQLLCSRNTVDCYNPKVVQSTMGSLTRVQINYLDLCSYLKEQQVPVFSADMNGKNVYQTTFPQEAILVMGNEANGISEETREIIDNQITIPRFGKLQQTESLNVATATAILLSEFRRGLK